MGHLTFDKLEPRRTLCDDAESALQGETGSRYRAFIKKTANERDPMRHAARRRKLRQRIRRIRSPVASRFRDLNEPGAQSQRRMSGEVRDREHLVSQRWNHEQVHLREDTSHLIRNCSAKAIGLNE